MPQSDNAKATSEDTAKAASFSPDQLLIIKAFDLDPNDVDADELDDLVGRLKKVSKSDVLSVNVNAVTNTEPAFEEGPHLKDPEVREAKRKQLEDYGITVDDERLTDDMRSILKDK